MSTWASGHALTLGAMSDESLAFYAGLVAGLLVGSIACLVYAKSRLESRHRRQVMQIERDRAERHSSIENAQAERQKEIDALGLERMRTEHELTKVQTQIARLELESRERENQDRSVTHSRLNAATYEKFQRENALLDVQLELARRDLALRGDHLQYHDTMMEKAKLEIDSLKLQVREQKKRLDEFGSGD
jgi:hypothetical protein